jgi:hypothetical protein
MNSMEGISLITVLRSAIARWDWFSVQVTNTLWQSGADDIPSPMNRRVLSPHRLLPTSLCPSGC